MAPTRKGTDIRPGQPPLIPPVPLPPLPHKQVGESSFLDMPAEHDTPAYQVEVAITACRLGIAAFMTTRQDDQVGCPGCKEATR